MPARFTQITDWKCDFPGCLQSGTHNSFDPYPPDFVDVIVSTSTYPCFEPLNCCYCIEHSKQFKSLLLQYGFTDQSVAPPTMLDDEGFK